ncbi:protein UTH1 [Trichophaea hybrida]|nr:protein UTH1 [Trichophaea hybrida]
MQLNAGLFTLALAGFSALTAAQPHKHHLNVRHPIKARNIVTEFVTKTVDQYGNDYPEPTKPAQSPQEYGSEVAQDGAEKPKIFNFVTVTTKSAVSATPAKVPENLVDSGISQKSTGSGVDQDFPDGEIDCSHFPSEYGAQPLMWVTKDGWSGIQVNGGNGDAIGKCTEGALCSYACPAGYSKAQWPDVQPASGESYGGLQCKDGKLHRTRTHYKKLCQIGKGTASVVNKLDQLVAFCRTDYPGSENMVVPLNCSPGSSQDLTVPDAANSYIWRGGVTSAQYYINNAGVGLEDGCIWGTPNGGKGNWSPLVVGAGYRNGKTWLSIAPNTLNREPANFNMKIVADDGAKISEECKYENGKFSNGNPNGCTVAIEDGSAHFELY